MDIMEFCRGALCNSQYDSIGSLDNLNSYRNLVLDNEMKVLLISNPTITEAECTMSVNVGSFSDPDDLPGLAHLCSRMIVLGTQKYPSYNGFRKFVSNHNGYSRIIMTGDQTNYEFKIDTHCLKNALLQFVHFFLTPLFRKHWMKEEINIINSEHKEFLMHDIQRLTQFIKHTVKSDHPFRRFAFGDKNSLKITPECLGINVISRLIEFYNRYYSANIMSLCVFTNESLDKIERTVVKLFYMVPNKKIEMPLQHKHPLKFQCCTEWYIVPKENIRSLVIVFPLPEIDHDYWITPLSFILELLKYKGEESLFSYLNRMHLCKSIMTKPITCARGIDLLLVIFTTNLEDISYVNLCIKSFFSYLTIVKNKCNCLTSIPLAQELYKTCINRVCKYNSETKSNDFKTASGFAELLRQYPIVDVLKTKPKLVRDIPWERSQNIITWILNNYISPENIKVYILTKQYENEVNNISPTWCDSLLYKEETILDETKNNWKDTYNLRFRLPSFYNFESYLIEKYPISSN